MANFQELFQNRQKTVVSSILIKILTRGVQISKL